MASISCTRPGCTGSIWADGYCDTCGAKHQATAPAAASPPPGAAPGAGAPGAGTPGAGTPAAGASSAAGPGFAGTSARAASVASPVPPSVRTSGGTSRRSASRRTAPSRARVGAGLVAVAPTPLGDPAAAVMSEDDIAKVVEVLPEDQRVCGQCAAPVGRTVAGRPGRAKGFCGNCRAPFDFTSNAPTLATGELLGGQYEIVGCLAHGGMGWIYLARDTAVSNRWVVLKGLLNSSDPDAILAAVAERQFLATVEHGNIVRIYNFVTWRGAGYIVMEYVGGASLNSKLKARRRANNGVSDPLPVPEALAYVLAILPALAHLHSLGLLYNDLKPANVMAVGDDVKLIDLGAVIRADDAAAAVFGTQGFQSPEVPVEGPSVASDIYTVGRTIAVLILDFVFHEGRYQYALPTPQDEPLFAEWESLYRFLLKCTATAPADRFETIDELADQLEGVLREIVARRERRPRPSTSERFTGDRLPDLFAHLGDAFDVDAADWRALPVPLVDPADPAAAALGGLHQIDGAAPLRFLQSALAEHRIEPTVEVRRRLARSMIADAADGGASTRAEIDAVLDELAQADPWDWRVDWLRGCALLVRGEPAEAADRFSRVWTDLPGEQAPKLAVALAAEGAGDHARAAELYDIVLTVDDSWVSAAFGLSRALARLGRFDDEITALERVPTTSAVYIDAQMAAARARIDANDVVDADDLHRASGIIDRLLLDGRTRTQMQVEVYERVLERLPASPPGTLPPALFGTPVEERSIRLALERAYRELARAAATKAERIELVDKANALRPRTIL
jgi:serine/threonine-protein kinase PknG